MSREKAIVFVDGNNLYHNLVATNIKPSQMNILKLSEYVCNHFNCKRVKTVYYNSVPSIEDGSEIYYNHMKFLNKIESFSNFEVKTRKLQRNSTFEVIQTKKELISSLDLCKKCKPVIESVCSDCIGSVKIKEKGIDVMIAVDMIDKSLIKKECDCCILISGDADFIPSMDLVKAGGKKVFSASLAKGYAFELRDKHKWFILDRKKILKECCD